MKHLKGRIGALILLTAFALMTTASALGAETLKIRYFKIGKADAFLLRMQDHAVLIDAGEEDDGPEIIEYLRKKDIPAIDCLILTHFDKRSIGGAPELLGAVPVHRVLIPDYRKLSNLREALSDALEGLQVEEVVEQTSFSFGDVALTVYPAQQASYAEDEDNDFSLVVSVTHGENSFFFSGDIMSERIEEMQQAALLTPHTVIKIPCHGQNITGLDRLLDGVSPTIAVIPASVKNPPAGAVTALLEGRGIRWYCTMNGSVTLTSDGHQVTVSQ